MKKSLPETCKSPSPALSHRLHQLNTHLPTEPGVSLQSRRDPSPMRKQSSAFQANAQRANQFSPPEFRATVAHLSRLSIPVRRHPPKPQSWGATKMKQWLVWAPPERAARLGRTLSNLEVCGLKASFEASTSRISSQAATAAPPNACP